MICRWQSNIAAYGINYNVVKDRGQTGRQNFGNHNHVTMLCSFENYLSEQQKLQFT